MHACDDSVCTQARAQTRMQTHTHARAHTHPPTNIHTSGNHVPCSQFAMISSTCGRPTDADSVNSLQYTTGSDWLASASHAHPRRAHHLGTITRTTIRRLLCVQQRRSDKIMLTTVCARVVSARDGCSLVREFAVYTIG